MKSLRTPGSVFMEMVPPPSTGSEVCEVCQTWKDLPDSRTCSNCIEIQAALGTSPMPLSVLTLYKKPSRMRDLLTFYKGRPEENEPPRPEYGRLIMNLLIDFFSLRGSDLYKTVGGYDAIVVVPSTKHASPHPLETICQQLRLKQPVLRLLERGDGELGFRHPSVDGYRLREDVSHPERILLVDDVYTTGARLNSAAFALRRSGIQVAGGLTIARRVNPDYSEEAMTFWNRQKKQKYSMMQSPVLQGDRYE